MIQPGIPESFHVLLKELQSLGLAVELRYEEAEELGIDDLDEGFGDEFGEGLPAYDLDLMDNMEFYGPETAAPAFPPGETIIDAEARPYDGDGDNGGNGNGRQDFTVSESSDGANGDV